jgi:hypothetical protein
MMKSESKCIIVVELRVNAIIRIIAWIVLWLRSSQMVVS